MKTEYPNYSRVGMGAVKEILTIEDKQDIEQFLKYCSMTCSGRSLKEIELKILQARDCIEKPLSQLNKDDVNGFVALANQSKRTQWTKNATLSIFKRFVRWKYKNLEMIENIKLKQAFNYQKINDSTLLTTDEQERMIKAADNFRDRAIVITLAESGIRPEELRHLKWKDVKFYDDHAELNVFSNKTRMVRTIPIKEAGLHLKRWKNEYCFDNLRESDLIFPGKTDNAYERNKVLGATGLSRIISKLAKKAKIERHVHPYLFRHSRLTALYANMPEQIVKKFAGHVADSEMPRIYSHISNKDVKDKMLEQIYHVEEINENDKSTIEKLRQEMKESEQRIINSILEELKSSKDFNGLMNVLSSVKKN